MWDDLDQERFSADTFQVLLDLLNCGDPDSTIVGLENLSETLAFGSEDLLQEFPLAEMSRAMVNLLDTSDNEMIQEASSRCIFQFLEAHSSSTRNLVNNNVYAVIKKRLDGPTTDPPVITNCLRALEIISEFRPGEIADSIGISSILLKYPILKLPEQRSCSHILRNCTSASVHQDFVNSLPQLLSLVSTNDLRIADGFSNTILFIAQNTNPSDSRFPVPPESITLLSSAIDSCGDPSFLLRFMQTLQIFCQSKDLALATILNPPNFQRLLSRSTFNGRQEMQSIITMSLSILSILVPFPNYPKCLRQSPNFSFPPNSNENVRRIVASIKEPIITFFTDHSEVSASALIILASVFAENPENRALISDELAQNLVALAQDYILAPYVLVIATILSKEAIIQRSGICRTLKAVENQVKSKSSNVFQWYSSELARFEKDCGSVSNIVFDPKAFNTFEELLYFVEENRITPFELNTPNFISVLSTLISSFKFTLKPVIITLNSTIPPPSKTPSEITDGSQKKSSKITQFFKIFSKKNEVPEKSEISEKPPEPVPQTLPNTKEFLVDNNVIGKFSNLLLEILYRAVLPDPREPFPNMSVIDYVQQTMNIDVNVLGESHSRNIFPDSIFIGIEGWFNCDVKGIADSVLINQLAHSPLKDILQLDPVQELSYSELAIWNRILKTPNHQKFYFSIDGVQASPFDSIFFVFSRLNSHNSRSFRVTLSETPEKQTKSKGEKFLKFKKEKSENVEEPEPQNSKAFEDFLTSLEKPEYFGYNEKMIIKPELTLDPKTKGILDLLKLLHEKTGIEIKSPKFEKKLLKTLQSPFLTTSLQSPGVQIAAHYPFLFSSIFRTNVLKLTSLSGKSVMNLFLKPRESFPNRRQRAKVCIDRSKLFEDGLLVTNTILSTMLPIDVTFLNEEGIGPGPTQEFFATMGKEFCKAERKLWRDDRSHGEYAWSTSGLYPMPNADLNLMYSLGLLCGAAVAMGCIVPIPLSTAFFSELLNNETPLNLIDEALARSLANPDGLEGLPFTYPGTDVPLRPNQNQSTVPSNPNPNISQDNEEEVTKENLVEYVKLVSKMTFAKDAIEAFKRGMEQHLAKGIWNILNVEEFAALVIGAETQFTNEELRQCIQFSHGYNLDSPQATMLFEVLLEFDEKQRELFFKFVTGCERLPVGGLRSLSPPLTVAKRTGDGQRPDECLPTVMTCMNYFKLPPYSSKVIMQEKLLLAISEGQGAFMLS